MKNLIYTSVTILALTAASITQAAVLIEPVLGYNFGDKHSFEDGKDYGGGYGPAYGGRLGYQKLGFQLGLDYLRSDLHVEGRELKSRIGVNEYAGFVGFKFPVFVGVYAGYIFAADGKAKYDDGSGTQQIEFKNGSGTKFGVAFTGLPFLHVNFEYRQGKFGEYELGGTTG